MYKSQIEEAQRKQAAWQKVKRLMDEALVLLVAVDEGHYEQADFIRISEKASVQMKLWTVPNGGAK